MPRNRVQTSSVALRAPQRNQGVTERDQLRDKVTLDGYKMNIALVEAKCLDALRELREVTSLEYHVLSWTIILSGGPRLRQQLIRYGRNLAKDPNYRLPNEEFAKIIDSLAGLAKRKNPAYMAHSKEDRYSFGEVSDSMKRDFILGRLIIAPDNFRSLASELVVPGAIRRRKVEALAKVNEAGNELHDLRKSSMSWAPSQDAVAELRERLDDAETRVRQAEVNLVEFEAKEAKLLKRVTLAAEKRS